MRFFFSIHIFFFVNTVLAQNEINIINVTKENGELDTKKIIKLSDIGNHKKVIILADERHEVLTIDSVRALLFCSIDSIYAMSTLFYEWPVVDYYIHNRIKIESQQYDSIVSYSNFLYKSPFTFSDLDSLTISENRKYFDRDFIKRLDKNTFIQPIDIGTGQSKFSITSLSWLTRVLNYKRIEIIDRFCDSITKDHQELFNFLLFTEISEVRFNDFLRKYIEFKESLLSNYNESSEICSIWDSLIEELKNKYFGKSSFMQYLEKKNPLYFRDYLNYRDSIMMKNIISSIFNLKQDNVIGVAVSSLHAIKNYSSNVINTEISDDYITMGQRLYNKFGDTLFSIAIVCSNFYLKNSNGKVIKRGKSFKSMEHKASRLYPFSLLINDRFNQNQKFYLTPSFNKMYKTNWLYMYDAILIVRDCNCR